MTRPLPAGYAGFFDPVFYQDQVGKPVADPLGHFRRKGDAAGLDPSPYFSTQYYKSRYPDWAAHRAKTALDDFLEHEAQGDWRSPHPCMQPGDYWRLNPDVAAMALSPSAHFVAHGDAEGRSPSDEFDAAFYRRSYLRLMQTHAMRHFVLEGKALGCLPRPVPRNFSESQAASLAVRADRPGLVILCVHDAQEAGTPILVLDIARELVARGRPVCFVLINGGPLVAAFKALGPVFLCSEGWNSQGLFAGFGSDVSVLVHSAAAARLAEAAACQGAPTCLMIHEMRGYIEGQGLLADLKRAQAAGAVLIASFPRMADAFKAELGTMAIIRPGLCLPAAALHAFRARRRLLGQTPVFISAGHADRRKGFDLFVQAAQAIRVQRPDASFVWLGALDPWAKDLATQAKATGLPLVLPGFVSDSLAWYAAASVYLLTSREDPGPTTLIHAAAMGTPFVGYDADIGLRGIADPLGQFVPAEDVQAFVAAACWFARSDTMPARRARRRLIVPHLGMTAYCDALLSQLP